jgi:hypothetical protein
MMNSGINRSANRRQNSFGDWALDTEFDWSERRPDSRPEPEQTGQDALSISENKKYASRRAAAYWESRK